MHIKSLRHVRDHVKVQGRAYELLTHIALHTNMHTGEAFELSVERLAHRHQITPEWTRRLLNGVIATGELVVERSRGRYPNRYRFPLERCPACQGDEINPEVQLGDDHHHERQPPTQPQTPGQPTLNSAAPPSVGKVLQFPGVQPQTAPLKENVKDEKEKNVHVEIKHPNPKRLNALTLREEDLVDELVRRFRDEKSRVTYQRIVSALGEDIAFRLMQLTWEVRDRIAVSLGAYYVGMSKQVAKEQGIDLGFTRAGPPSKETTR